MGVGRDFFSCFVNIFYWFNFRDVDLDYSVWNLILKEMNKIV